jgi:hypothetical protein
LDAWGVTNARVLQGREVHRFIREAWDVSKVDEYREWQMHQLADEVNGPNEAINMRKAEPRAEVKAPAVRHWPERYIRAHKKDIDIDGNLHAVLMLINQPEWTLGDVLRQIDTVVLQSGFKVANMSRAVVSEAGKSTKEYAFVGLRINMTNTIRELIFARERPKSRMNAERDARAEDAAASNKVLQRHYILIDVAVAGPTDPRDKQELALCREVLDENIEAVRRRARALGLAPLRVKGESRLLQASFTATTGIDML